MDHSLFRLLALKAQLYAILAAISMVLVFIAGYLCQHETQGPPDLGIGICGNVSPNFEEPMYQAGRELFNTNCAACHNKNMKDDLTGPALSGLDARWADYPRADLYAWIRHSQQLIQEQHPRAVSLWEKWGPTKMTDFPTLTDEQIEQLLVYIGP